jgi:D-glycero-D-manno-heptose 1,7-bisphosphate phosphatase
MSPLPRAVLLDRDGTLIVDVPYNGDPDLVRPVPSAVAALDLLRVAGIPTALVSNQSAISRGLITAEQAEAVFARTEELLGPLGPVFYCPHQDSDHCHCRKPHPGLLLEACEALGVEPHDAAMIGDSPADVGAARNAGCRPVLISGPALATTELAHPPETVPDLLAAVTLLLRTDA